MEALTWHVLYWVGLMDISIVFKKQNHCVKITKLAIQVKLLNHYLIEQNSSSSLLLEVWSMSVREKFTSTTFLKKFNHLNQLISMFGL